MTTIPSTPLFGSAPIRVSGASPVATKFSTGADLATSEDAKVPPGACVIIKTNARVHFDGEKFPGVDIQVRPRSSTLLKHGLIVMLGTIDADYKDPIGIIVFNPGHRSISVPKGTRLAQLVAVKAVRLEGMEVADEERQGGFGSSGK